MEAVSIDSVTGELSIDEELFALQEKPLTVQLLLLKYKESRELEEQVSELIDEIDEIQESNASVNLLLSCQNEANFELYDIGELHSLWLNCAHSVVKVPRLAEFFAKVELVAAKERDIQSIALTSSDGLKTAFSEIFACCRTGVKTRVFAAFYNRVMGLQ